MRIYIAHIDTTSKETEIIAALIACFLLLPQHFYIYASEA